MRFPNNRWNAAGWLLTAVFAVGALPLSAQTPVSAPSAAHHDVTSHDEASQRLVLPTASPIGDLFSRTITDFRRLPSSDNLTFLTVSTVAAALAHQADRSITQRLSSSPRLTSVFRPGATLGGARGQIGGALATYTIGRITGNERTAAIGAALIRAQFLSQALTGTVKAAVQRTRPDGSKFSFPSGHTSVTFASATVLRQNLGWKVGGPAYAVATYVAASRIQTKRHFLSDVTFGAALGIMAGRAVTVGSGRARFTIAPSATRDGGAIGFTWIGGH